MTRSCVCIYRIVKISAFNRNLALRACGFWESGVTLCGTCQAGWACTCCFHCSSCGVWPFPRPFFLVAIKVVAPVSDVHCLLWKRYRRQPLLSPCWAGRVSNWTIEKRRESCHPFSVVVLPTHFRSGSSHLSPPSRFPSWFLQPCLVAQASKQNRQGSVWLNLAMRC